MRKIYILLFVSIFSLTCCASKPDDGKSGETPIEVASGMDLYGLVTDEKGIPVEGVVVSDGYSCVVTGANGVYQMKRSRKARFVFYSTPSDFAIEVERDDLNIGYLYRRIDAVQGRGFRCDFTLRRLDAPETKFKVLCLADIQVDNETHVGRFRDETMVDIKKLVAGDDSPFYALALGDIVGDVPEVYPSVKKAMGSSRVPMFAAIGNHDKVPSPNNPVKNDEYFCQNFGPTYYSFNRGDVHFVCLDDVYCPEDGSRYRWGVLDDQVEWLRQDLSHVPKNKILFLYFHIPFRGETMNRTAIFELLDGYKEVHFLSGHIHCNRYWDHYDNGYMLAEHMVGAVCGAYWRATINGDGTPNGYAVYEFDGNTTVNSYYKSTNYDEGYQIRLTRGNTYFGGSTTFSFGLNENTLVANVWNIHDKRWTSAVYEDGVLTGTLEKYTLNWCAWSVGYLAGVLGFNAEDQKVPCPHIYRYQIKNPNATVRVEVTDHYGNVFSATSDEIETDVKKAGPYE